MSLAGSRSEHPLAPLALTLGRAKRDQDDAGPNRISPVTLGAQPPSTAVHPVMRQTVIQLGMPTTRARGPQPVNPAPQPVNPARGPSIRPAARQSGIRPMNLWSAAPGAGNTVPVRRAVPVWRASTRGCCRSCGPAPGAAAGLAGQGQLLHSMKSRMRCWQYRAGLAGQGQCVGQVTRCAIFTIRHVPAGFSQGAAAWIQHSNVRVGCAWRKPCAS